MSYPNAGLDDDGWRRAATGRVAALAAEAERLGVVLLLENCVGWAGTDSGRMRFLLERVDSPSLRVVFDAGNGVWYGYGGPEFLADCLAWVEHVHVKDGRARPGEPVEATYPGAGQARLAVSLRMLRDAGYAGWYSLEPHLARMPHLGAAGDTDSLAESFTRYATCFATFWQDQVAEAAPRRPAAGRAPATTVLSGDDVEWLLALAAIPSVSPLEGGALAQTARMQQAFADGAVERG